MKQKLKEGISCEVASHVVEMTEIMLRGWQEFDQFTIHPSDNAGWTLFVPTNSQPKEPGIS